MRRLCLTTLESRDYMRVITGEARGRKLEAVEGYDTRPTSDRIKESIFNIIQFDIEGRRVLDLFAGTGQLGVEALSRGAREAVFVDTNADAIKVIKANLKTTGFDSRSRTVNTDYRLYLQSKPGKFDIVFIDPPYKTDLCDKALIDLVAFDILSDGGIIVCETPQNAEIHVGTEEEYQINEYKYGHKKITVCRKLCAVT